MKSRRRTSIILLMATSVFLCLFMSCGIPTYIVPKVNFTPGTTSASTTFSVSYIGDGVGDYGKVGLIILYYPDTAEAIDSSDKTKIVNKFSSNYKVSTNDGIVIDVKADEPVYEITTTNTDTGTGYIYAFELDGRAVQSPTYTHSMSTSGDFSSSVTITYEDGFFELSVDGAEESISLTIDDDVDLKITPYLHIYAAISVQSSQYSNIFWSSLSHVGTINTTQY